MEDDHIDISQQLLNFQRTCSVLPLFQPILLGFFCCTGRLDLSLPVLIFLLFFSSSVVTLLAKEHYKWINECHEEIGNCLLDFFFDCFSKHKCSKNLEDTRTGNFLFLFFSFCEDHLKIPTGSFLCNATQLGMLQIVVSHFLVEFSYGKMCACHLKIIFKHMENPLCLKNVEIWSKMG